MKQENWELFFQKNGKEKRKMNAKTNEQTEMIIGEMKCLVAEYCSSSIFKLPLGLDLKDGTVVRDYWVKWDMLTVSLMNGETLHIHPYNDEGDKKHPELIRIDDIDDWGIEYDEDDVVEYDCYDEKEEAKEAVKNTCYNCGDETDNKVVLNKGSFTEREDFICEPCIEEKKNKETCIDCGEKPKYDDGVCEDCYEKITAESDTESKESETPSEKSTQEEHNANNEGYDQFPERRVEGQTYYIKKEDETYTYDKQNDWWSKYPNERLEKATEALAMRNAEDLAFASSQLIRPNKKDDESDDCCMSCGVQESYKNFCCSCLDIRMSKYVRDDGLTDFAYKDGMKEIMMPLRNTINKIEDSIDGLMTYEEGERDVEDLKFWKDIADQIADRQLINRK